MSLDLTAILVAIIGALGGLLAYLQARAANRRSSDLERRKIDIEAHNEHWKRTDALIERLSAEIERLDIALARTREEMDRAHTDNELLRTRLTSAELHISRLKTVLAVLLEEMENKGVPVPARVEDDLP